MTRQFLAKRGRRQKPGAIAHPRGWPAYTHATSTLPELTRLQRCAYTKLEGELAHEEGVGCSVIDQHLNTRRGISALR